MKHIISSTALVMAISMTPALAAANNYGGEATAHERCKRDEDNKQVLGGLAGAVVGGVFGSQVSGNGARTEGSAIGAVLGGLAGAGLADKAIDCDPVYEDRNQGYQSQGYQNQGYQTSGASYPATTSTTYSGAAQSYGTSQPYYEDRVTVSNHPVYSNPTYGAGGVTQGTTYSSGTVSYPPSGNNSQYASQTSAPTYSSTPTYGSTYGSGTSYGTTQGARVYTAATPPVYSQPRRVVQPVSHQTVYRSAPQPTYTTRPPARRIGRHTEHRHGRYSCNMHH